MYETRKQRPLSKQHFRLRMLAHFGVAIALISISLGIGMAGYCGFEHLSATDGFLNTAMLLGGMGPVNSPATEGGKLFAGLFALYAGLVFIVTAALLFTPLLHRLMHRFHWEDQ
jgi:hypothetical protein